MKKIISLALALALPFALIASADAQGAKKAPMKPKAPKMASKMAPKKMAAKKPAAKKPAAKKAKMGKMAPKKKS